MIRHEKTYAIAIKTHLAAKSYNASPLAQSLIRGKKKVMPNELDWTFQTNHYPEQKQEISETRSASTVEVQKYIKLIQDKWHTQSNKGERPKSAV